MKHIGGLVKKDMVLGFKDMFIILELVFAAAISALLIFVIPEDIKTEDTAYIYDSTGIVIKLAEKFAPDDAGESGDIFVDSREEIISGMTEHRNAIGLILSRAPGGKFGVEVLTQPYTPGILTDYIELEMEDIFSMLKPPFGLYSKDILDSYRIESLQSGMKDDIPFNKRILPVMLTTMVGIIGMFAMVSLVGQEKADLTIKAFTVTPAGLAEFIFSKHIVILFTSFCSFSILYLPLMGPSGFPASAAVMILTVILGSCIGIILGTFFPNPLSAMLWVFLIMIVFAMPAISLFAPIFSPLWLRAIPTWHTIFGLDAAMFPEGGSRIVVNSLIYLAAAIAVMLPLSTVIFSRSARRNA